MPEVVFGHCNALFLSKSRRSTLPVSPWGLFLNTFSVMKLDLWRNYFTMAFLVFCSNATAYNTHPTPQNGRIKTDFSTFLLIYVKENLHRDFNWYCSKAPLAPICSRRLWGYSAFPLCRSPQALTHREGVVGRQPFKCLLGASSGVVPASLLFWTRHTVRGPQDLGSGLIIKYSSAAVSLPSAIIAFPVPAVKASLEPKEK